LNEGVSVYPSQETPSTIGEVVDLVRAYVRQQTISPLRGAGRWVVFGLFGGFLLIIGLVFLAIGGLRALQTMSAFDDEWSFVPYFAVLIFSIAVIGVAKGRISIGTLHPGDK
jgi:hypothetical protein